MNKEFVRDRERWGHVLVSTLGKPYLTPVSPPLSAQEATGFGFRCKKDAFAIFVRQGVTILRINGHEWNLDRERVKSHYFEGFMLERFSLVCAGGPSFKRIYLRTDGIRNLMEDPTLDAIDWDSLHPLKTVHKLVQNEPARTEWALRQETKPGKAD